ncbi:hypothetical protein Dcae01_03158 [Deinococcus caeni]|uniref:Peptidase C39 n=1 Tax=Deinococcus caeni TaxID=569127 RepID=A0ABP9UIY1_9DEIO
MTRRWWLILGAGWSWSVASAQPASVTLKNIRHDFQALNNCAPVTAMTLLGYYGASVTQAQAAAVMKDYPGDPQVTSLELASYLGRAGLQSVIRYAGDAELLRSLVAFPPARAGEVQRLLGSDYSAAANWQHLRAHGEQDVKARPRDPYAWWGLAKATLRLGNAALASDYFERAVNLGVPTMYYLYRKEAFEAWTQAGRHSRTLSVTQRALQAFPRSKELQYFRTLAGRAVGESGG